MENNSHELDIITQDTRNPQFDFPWLDRKLKDDAIQHLWNIIKIPAKNLQNKELLKRYGGSPERSPSSHMPLAGNISKSEFIVDTDNWFYNNVLKEMSDFLYYKNWNYYYDIKITKSKPPPIFQLPELWVNYQKKHEFNPPHKHRGIFSFVVFMKIPTHWKEQHALPFSANSNTPVASDFAFLSGQHDGTVAPINIPLSPEDEGRILFFPAELTHMVYPFYGSDEERITMSGNIIFANENAEEMVQDNKKMLVFMEAKIAKLKEAIKAGERFEEIIPENVVNTLDPVNFN